MPAAGKVSGTVLRRGEPPAIVRNLTLHQPTRLLTAVPNWGLNPADRARCMMKGVKLRRRYQDPSVGNRGQGIEPEITAN